MTRQRRYNVNPFLLGFVITAGWSSAVFFSITTILKMDPAKLFQILPNIFFNPSHNYCRFGNIDGIPLIGLLAYITIVSALTTFLARSFFLHRSNFSTVSSVLPIIISNVIILTAFFQVAGQIKFTFEEYKETLANPNHREYHAAILSEIYDYAELCKLKLPGAHSAQLITDLNITQDPGMLIHRFLAYYLYPIDIRNVRKAPPDCLIIFSKRNPALNVPANYLILGGTNESNLLAVRKDTMQ